MAKKETPELTADDYKLILSSLAFYIGTDLSIDTADDKMDKELLSLMEKVKQIGFKRKPKLTMLSYSKSSIKDKGAVLDNILKIVDLVETE